MNGHATTTGTVISTVSCARCGTSAEGPPLTWATSVETGRLQYYCDGCARDNLHAIEARLDPGWW